MASSTKLWTVRITTPAGHEGVYQIDDELVKALGAGVLSSSNDHLIEMLIERERA